MLKIYGVYRSRASRVYWMALELGIEFESIPVIQASALMEPNTPGARLNTQSPEFLKVNPNGQIPAVDDDGLVLWESGAINLYLASKHRGPLAPGSLLEEGAITNWAFWAVTELEAHTIRIVKTYDNNLEETPGGKEVIAVATRMLKKPFEILNNHLAENEYLVGDRFTVADLNTVEIIRYAMTEKSLFSANPNVQKWLERCHGREAFQKMMAGRAAEA